ncbi:hypothetical protein ACFLYT_00970 [Nanoarchaeota archaeon]
MSPEDYVSKLTDTSAFTDTSQFDDTDKMVNVPERREASEQQQPGMTGADLVKRLTGIKSQIEAGESILEVKVLREDSDHLVVNCLGTELSIERYEVESQPVAYKLPSKDKLPMQLKTLYALDGDIGESRYCTKETILLLLQTCAYWEIVNGSPLVAVSGMSKKEFSSTRSGGSKHNKGIAIDVKLQKEMMVLPGDGDTVNPMYNDESRIKCAELCLCAAEAGAQRIIYNDNKIIAAMRSVSKVTMFPWKGHKNHMHFDLYTS